MVFYYIFLSLLDNNMRYDILFSSSIILYIILYYIILYYIILYYIILYYIILYYIILYYIILYYIILYYITLYYMRGSSDSMRGYYMRGYYMIWDTSISDSRLHILDLLKRYQASNCRILFRFAYSLFSLFVPKMLQYLHMLRYTYQR